MNSGGAPSFSEALRFWLKLGWISFGGPAGQIALMHSELVEKKRWISEERFLHALNFCMLLPGPEAQQLTIYIGWLLHRTWGGIVAGVLFVLPSSLLLWLLGFIYLTWGRLAAMTAIFDGLKPVVFAIVLSAVMRIGGKALKNAILCLLAVLAFIAIFFFSAPFPLLIVCAAAVGLIGQRLLPGQFPVPPVGHEIADPAHTAPTLGRLIRVSLVCLSVWWTPILCVGAWLGWGHVLFQEGLFFSKAAMVTFGGAYAVLPYVSQQAVEQFHWLAPGQMLDGLALAETTPGPLIMVLQFVGFVGAWKMPEPFTPLLAATLGAAITTWATFAPCFYWVFLGAPYIERLRGNIRVAAALSAITAAVVGVILNLALWFGLHVLVPMGKPNWFAIVLAAGALIGLVRWKWNVLAVVAAAGAVGLAKQLVFG